jgi:serine/threonine protein kinase/Tol biopolymer transport system component
MPLTAGARLGVYEIQFLLGAGCMGEVYCARDTRLHRDVAMKVLPELFASDLERLVRFDREAQLLASLNHPHIAHIYGFEDFTSTMPGQAAVRALVMELVDGPTLADRIATGAIPLEEALSIAHQIAAALEAAHERGIIHRDLKPANIKLTAGGSVKLLDFGLAKALDPLGTGGAARSAYAGRGGVGSSQDPMNSPTFASPGTELGVILGSPAYMAPEQARGQAVDKRADIWAFGVVLYEMLTGRRLFEGETVSDTMAAVLRHAINWTELPADTPDEVRRLLRRCLERDPINRLHDAADARLMIADIQRDGPVAPRASPRTRTPWVYAGAFALAIAMIGAGFAFIGAKSPRIVAPNPVVRFTIDPPAGVASVSNVTLAADGRFIVYEGQVEGESRLYLRRLDALDSRLLGGTEGARWPFISPDGAWVGFFRGAKIYKVSTDGGDVLAVCDVRGGPGATWDDHGQIIFSRTWLSGLSIVPADGGTPRVLTNPDAAKREIGHWWPSMLPGGHVLFTIVTAGAGLNDARIAVLDPASGTYQVLFAGARATWLPSGHIVFYRTGRYHAVAFDLTAGKVVGDPFPVLEDAQELDPSGDWQQPMTSAPSGALAYLPGPYVPPSRLTWIDATGALTPLSFAARPFVSVKLSPDGRRAATGSMESGRLLIRLYDLERDIEDTPKIDGMNFNPAWLPDGRLSFTSMRKGDFDVYVKDLGSTQLESAVLAGPDDTDPVAWTRDGRLVFQGSEPDGAYPLKLYDPGHVPQTTRLTEQHVENGGSLSPDDRWLAYETAANGRPLVYVRPLEGSGPAIGLSRSAGEFPVFLRDGKTLAFIRGQELVVVPWSDHDGVFETGAARAVVRFAFGSGWTYGAPYDAAPGGRFLALVRTEVSPPPRIRVVLGWDQEVRKIGQSLITNH